METRKISLLEKTAGAFLVAAGIAGLLLPVIPGWALIFAGLALMGERRIFNWIKAKHAARFGKKGKGSPPSAENSRK